MFNGHSLHCRYLLQFYLNFNQKPAYCPVTHFAPHLLKTLELFNYAFNAFVSIVSGKHGRRELIDMLFCRAIPAQPSQCQAGVALVAIAARQSSASSRAQSQARLNNKTEVTHNATTKSLLPMTEMKARGKFHRVNHYHYQ